MKKVILSIAVIACAASSQAQFYGKVGVGLNMSAASQVLSSNVTTTDEEVVRGSYGKGIAPVLGVGYMLNDHFGVELAASYLLGGKIKSNDKFNSYTSDVETSAKGLNLLPALVLKGGNADSKIRPYMRTGLHINLGSKITTKQTIVEGTDKTEMAMEEKTKLAIGYTGAFGLSFKASKNMSVWVEVVGSSVSGAYKSGEITEYKENGVDVLSTLDNKTWKYEDKLADSNQVDELSKNAPLSSIGLAVGVSLNIGGKK